MTTTEERLANLERELARAKRRNRRLLAVAGLAVGAFALVWIVAGTANRAEAQGAAVPAVIRAKKFILEDENGNTRIALGTDQVLDLSPLKEAMKNPGTSRFALVQLTVMSGPGLTVYDEKGKARIMLYVSNEALTPEPTLILYDEKCKQRTHLCVDKDGPLLRLRDEKGKDRLALGVMEGRTPDGKIIIYPESSLALFGPDGKMIWQAP